MNTNELRNELRNIMNGNLTPARAARVSEIAYELTHNHYLGHWAHQCAADAHQRMVSMFFRQGDTARRDASIEQSRLHRHLATDCFRKFMAATDSDECATCGQHESTGCDCV